MTAAATVSSATVRYESENGAGHIIFDRPKANSYDRTFMGDFHAALNCAAADDSARVVAVRSTLLRFFCAGADIQAFAANSEEENRRLVDLARAATAKIEASEKLFIAVIAGHALGGGLEIAMACDLRFACEGDYLLGLPETRLGLIPGNGGSQRLLRLVGPGKALELMALGDNIGPAEAARIGLVNRLFPADQFDAEVERRVAELARGPSRALAALKRAVQRGQELTLTDGLQLEASLVGDLYATFDAKEGFDAFVEKRAPQFRGE